MERTVIVMFGIILEIIRWFLVFAFCVGCLTFIITNVIPWIMGKLGMCFLIW